jgi:DNA-directed RNA polymerase subunit L
MVSPIISNYADTRSTKVGNDIYKVSFKLNNSSNAMANAIRRILLGGLPIVSFDDTYHDNHDENKLFIKKNISVLHNEFISHRISLLPICMYKNNSLKILIKYNFTTAEYKYVFANEQAVPTFTLKVSNIEETRIELGANKNNTIDVVSKFIKILDPEDYNDVDEFILPDYLTGDYCLIHRLKPISSNDDVQEAEELDIEMKPTINTARAHARYCPVGTVSYEFEKDSPEKRDEYFKAYIENLQVQRIDDKLTPYNDDDILLFRGTFDNLGAERIYKKQDDGDAETVVFNVESVGNLESHQLVYDTLEMIRLKTLVLLNHFEWDERDRKYKYSDKKINIIMNPVSGFCEIMIFKEDHTLGNLIGSYLKKLFITKKIMGDLLSFATYKLPHPLEDKITVIIGFKENTDLNGLFTRFGFKTTSDNSVKAIQLIFIACSYYLNHLSQIKNKWTELTGIKETSYELESNDLLKTSYYDKSEKI